MLLNSFLLNFKLREKLGITVGERPPTLVPVSHVMMCMNCGCDFTLTLRRHHCHACGKVRDVQLLREAVFTLLRHWLTLV